LQFVEVPFLHGAATTMRLSCNGGVDMIAQPAQYLLRFDDLCPTVARERWRRFLPLIAEFGVRPILAVVPNNRDPELMLSPPDPGFWAQMRAMEAAGATIAMHGFRHLCNSQGRSLVPLAQSSEFAGVPEPVQRLWVRAGLRLLRGYGLNPRVWVAPRHGFDHATLRVLREEGISLLSDGFARCPFVSDRLTWIPQQLWAPLAQSKGLWTICIHANTARDEEVEQLQAFLRHYGAQFTSVESVLDKLSPTGLGLSERLRGLAALRRIQASRIAKQMLHAVN
jgi:predicted deacetylase